MIFNEHSQLVGEHAFLSASNYHWLNYDLEKLEEVWKTSQAKELGTRLHAFASEAIQLRQKLAPSKKALNRFVNDAIVSNMESEKVLFYSRNCFGTADAISFRNNLLRISDLKTGVTKASMNQLMIYAALFCLEYKHKPDKIGMELRIYQGVDIELLVPDPVVISGIMEKIIEFDKHIEK